MRKTLFPIGLAAALTFSGAAFAAAETIEAGDVLGADADAIRATLIAQGYQVRKIEAEDDELEAYAVRDGRRYEIYISAKTGAVTRVNADD